MKENDAINDLQFLKSKLSNGIFKERLDCIDMAIKALEKQELGDKELESHDERHILNCCIGLMQELTSIFEDWYRWMHGDDAIEELDEEERFHCKITYFHIVQMLFLFTTNRSGSTSTRAKCDQLGVDPGEELEFGWWE